MSPGDVDIATIGAALADPRRCRILLALDDGRALPATRLAAEAGVSASTASHHLGMLVSAGLLAVEPHGRHRYFRLAGPAVGALLEQLTQLAPTRPVRSLREDTRARALRTARTCYDHLAGRLGVALMRNMIDRELLTGGDGHHDPQRADRDGPVGRGVDLDYRLTTTGRALLGDLGVALPPERRLVDYCVDWTEQRHHLAGVAGRGLLVRFHELGWLHSAPTGRAVRVTPAGTAGLVAAFGPLPGCDS